MQFNSFIRKVLICGGLLSVYAGPVIPAHAQSGQQSATLSPARVELMLDELVTLLVTASDAHWHKGEYNHNINLTRMVVVGRPDLVDMYANAGWLLWSMNRDAEAVAFYQQGLKANPNTFHLYDELGQYNLRRKKDYAAAAKYYAQAVKFSDVKPQTWNAYAHALEKSGQINKALKAWEKAASYPNNVAAAPNLARVRNIIRQRGGN